MNKVVKKIIVAGFALLFTAIMPLQVFGKNLGTLTYWDDNEKDAVGRWGESSTSIPSGVRVNKLNNNDKFYFTEGFAHAFRQWGGAMNRTFLKSAAQTTHINYYGGTASQINSTHVFNSEVGGELGITYITFNREGTWQYGSSTKKGNIITYAKGYVVDYSGRNINSYRNTCTHEFGHALGWEGHTSDTESVMYPTDAYTNITLSFIDKRHLQQVYNIRTDYK